MGSEFLFHSLLIAGFAGIQSIFGMGVLVFGTPTFLLMGFGFTETLGILLPSSLLISLAQVLLHKGPRPKISKSLFALCVPAIGLSLFIAISADITRHAYVLVAIALVVSAAARMVPQVQNLLRRFITGNLKAYHVTMGVFHGLTNMGGALLAVMAATIHQEKVNARYVIALYYLTFVVIQSIVIVSTYGIGIFKEGLLYAPLSITVYFIFGNRMFNAIKNDIFQKGMNVFLLFYAIVLVVKWVGFN